MACWRIDLHIVIACCARHSRDADDWLAGAWALWIRLLGRQHWSAKLHMCRFSIVEKKGVKISLPFCIVKVDLYREACVEILRGSGMLSLREGREARIVRMSAEQKSLRCNLEPAQVFRTLQTMLPRCTHHAACCIYGWQLVRQHHRPSHDEHDVKSSTGTKLQRMDACLPD